MDDNSRPMYGVSTKVERLALLIQNDILPTCNGGDLGHCTRHLLAVRRYLASLLSLDNDHGIVIATWDGQSYLVAEFNHFPTLNTPPHAAGLHYFEESEAFHWSEPLVVGSFWLDCPGGRSQEFPLLNPSWVEREAHALMPVIDAVISSVWAVDQGEASRWKIARDVWESLLPIGLAPHRECAPVVSEGALVGVSLWDCAEALAELHGDEPCAASVRAWSKRSGKPPSIGKCPLHSQRDLFSPQSLAAFIVAVEEQGGLREPLEAKLIERARMPRRPAS